MFDWIYFYCLLFIFYYLFGIFWQQDVEQRALCVVWIPCVPFVHLKRSCRPFSLVEEHALFNLGLRYMTVVQVVSTVLTNWYVTIFFGISVRAFLFPSLLLIDGLIFWINSFILIHSLFSLPSNSLFWTSRNFSTCFLQPGHYLKNLMRDFRWQSITSQKKRSEESNQRPDSLIQLELCLTTNCQPAKKGFGEKSDSPIQLELCPSTNCFALNIDCDPNQE